MGIFNLFKTKEPKITTKVSDDGKYANVYRNGKKSNVRLSLFSQDDIDHLHNLAEEIYKNKYNE